ncbi:hypothetical protein DNTS_030479 [Danionella cerebrum]|uniref:MACPF domain-containing protein n=1 Tax=Danionella cerebrum TaxID=2873325 RepID=A0A553MM04_9TELE|nr:hypothetical protein DNTS_030479 [Danionella translucida]
MYGCLILINACFLYVFRQNASSRHPRAVNTPPPIDCKLSSWMPWSHCDSCTDRKVRFQALERASQFGGERCIHSQWDERECPEEGDCVVPENHCGDYFACGPKGRCIAQPLRCDGENDCINQNDESDCTTINRRETKCNDMILIPGTDKATKGEKAQSSTEESSEYFEDAVSFLRAKQTENSFNFGIKPRVAFVEVGLSVSAEWMYLKNISKFTNKESGFVRILSTIQTAQFKMRSRDLVLHEDMLWALGELPDDYHFGAYSQFFNEYGTHYVTEGTMGGLMDYVAVVDINAMAQSETNGQRFGMCVGLSLGLVLTDEVSVSAKAKGCGKTQSKDTDSDSSSSKIKDVFGYLLPIYELVRWSTSAEQLGSKLAHLIRAWEEYMESFDSCRCAPCMNNGVPMLSQTACSCLCKNGYTGTACEETERKGPTDGVWSCWGPWTACTSGMKSRRRVCNNPPPKDGGLPCRGDSEESRRC